MISSYIFIYLFAFGYFTCHTTSIPLSNIHTDEIPVSPIRPRALARQFTQQTQQTQDTPNPSAKKAKLHEQHPQQREQQEQEPEIHVHYVDLYVRAAIRDNTYVSLDTSRITCDVTSQHYTQHDDDKNQVFKVQTHTRLSTIQQLCGTLAGVYTLHGTNTFKPASAFAFFDAYKQAHGRLSELNEYWVCLMWDSDDALGFISHTMPIEKCPILLQLDTRMTAYHTKERIFFSMHKPYFDASELIMVPFVFPYTFEENGARVYSYSVLDFTDVYDNLHEYDKLKNINRGTWQIVLVTKTQHQYQHNPHNTPSHITISSDSDEL